VRSKEVKTRCSLAESFKESHGSKTKKGCFANDDDDDRMMI
jgi:hypothetical protein